MDKINKVRQEIEKTKVILKESQENYKKNPDDYSAQLLLLTTENYLTDLLKELDTLQAGK